MEPMVIVLAPGEAGNMWSLWLTRRLLDYLLVNQVNLIYVAQRAEPVVERLFTVGAAPENVPQPVLLRPQIDEVLDSHRDWLQPEPGMLIAPHTVVHILLLQLLYSVPSEQQLHEQLNYNLLFLWFVGLDLNQKVWGIHVLQRDIASVLGNPRAVQLIQTIIGEVFCGALLHVPEFSLNFALLHTWLARHSHLSTTSN